jgi:hypothetical protein
MLASLTRSGRAVLRSDDAAEPEPDRKPLARGLHHRADNLVAEGEYVIKGRFQSKRAKR